MRGGMCALMFPALSLAAGGVGLGMVSLGMGSFSPMNLPGRTSREIRSTELSASLSAIRVLPK